MRNFLAGHLLRSVCLSDPLESEDYACSSQGTGGASCSKSVPLRTSDSLGRRSIHSVPPPPGQCKNWPEDILQVRGEDGQDPWDSVCPPILPSLPHHMCTCVSAVVDSGAILTSSFTHRQNCQTTLAVTSQLLVPGSPLQPPSRSELCLFPCPAMSCLCHSHFSHNLPSPGCSAFLFTAATSFHVTLRPSIWMAQEQGDNEILVPGGVNHPPPHPNQTLTQ